MLFVCVKGSKGACVVLNIFSAHRFSALAVVGAAHDAHGADLGVVGGGRETVALPAQLTHDEAVLAHCGVNVAFRLTREGGPAERPFAHQQRHLL